MKNRRKEDGLLNWESYEHPKHDIAGRCSCRVCGGDIAVIKGPEDFEDNTDQLLKCFFCGWAGTRKILYKRSGNCRCSYSKVYLKTFLALTNDIMANSSLKLDIPQESGRIELFSYQDEFLCLIKNEGKTYYVEKLSYISIQWASKRVMFHFLCIRLVNFEPTKETENLSIKLDFDLAQLFLDTTNLYKNDRPKLGEFKNQPIVNQDNDIIKDTNNQNHSEDVQLKPVKENNFFKKIIQFFCKNQNNKV